MTMKLFQARKSMDIRTGPAARPATAKEVAAYEARRAVKPIMKFTPQLYRGISTTFTLYPDSITNGRQTHSLRGVHAELSVGAAMGTRTVTITGPGFAWAKRIANQVQTRATKFCALVNGQAEQYALDHPDEVAAPVHEIGTAAGGTSLESLVAMHAAGDLTDAEFAAAKAQLLHLGGKDAV